MREQLRNWARVTGLMLGDILAVLIGLVAATGIASIAFSADAQGGVYQLLPSNTIPALLTLQILGLAASGAYAGYVHHHRLRVVLASLLASSLFFVGLRAYSYLGVSGEAIILSSGGIVLAVLIGRQIGRGLYKKARRAGLGLRRVALITTPAAAAQDAERIAGQSESPVHVCETIVVERPLNGGRKIALQALDRVSRDPKLAGIVVSIDAPAKLVRIVIDGCEERGLPIYVVPPFRQYFSPDVRAITSGPLTVLDLMNRTPRLPQMTLKRVLDTLAAGLGLLLLSPLILVIGALIKLDNPGPVFFAQTRVGLGGRTFRMLKFRTMIDGADSQKREIAHLNGSGDCRLFKVACDPRVTRVGRLLRKYSLDEVPQLWNVLRGEMSLVGPRPFFPEDLKHYEPHHFRRYSVLPGITGQWQVNGRSHIQDFEAVVAHDLDYISNWSLRRDFAILFKTLPAVFRGDGAM